VFRTATASTQFSFNRLEIFEVPMLAQFPIKTGPPNHSGVPFSAILSSSQALAPTVYDLITIEPLPLLTIFIERFPLDQVLVAVTVLRRCYTFVMAVADVSVAYDGPKLAQFIKAIPSDQLVPVIRPVGTAGQTLPVSIHQSP
jgi:hypothetical protein